VQRAFDVLEVELGRADGIDRGVGDGWSESVDVDVEWKEEEEEGVGRESEQG
jgi:hypothetical protein